MFSGSSSITHYQLVIIKNGEEERNLTKPFEPGQTDYSIPKTPSSFYTPNAKFEASIRAVSDVGSSLASSDTFVLPGRKNPIVSKLVASMFSMGSGCSL